MNNSQKRRNYTKELISQTKSSFFSHYKSDIKLHLYHPNTQFKERTLNKSIIAQEQTDYCFRTRPSTQFYRNLSTMDYHIDRFNQKIKGLLKYENSCENKQNSMRTINASRYSYKSKQSILRGSEVIGKQLVRSSQNIPYFIQCLKRQSNISTQACMHIHRSILTFKQHLRPTQFINIRTPDQKIPKQIYNRKTIVFDLDQTLIHTSQHFTQDYQIKVPFKSVKGQIVNGYVNVRPYAKQIIKNMGKHYDIIIFTAANQNYADPILDYLDPEGHIKYRLYRQSCTMITNQIFVKDLRILGRNLQNVVLVDNAPHSYMLQLQNGIPILNYIKGKSDDQLIQLQKYLMTLLHVQDVRVVNSETFKLNQYVFFESYERLIQDLYAKWL